jgi:hypothetical protein
METASSKQRCRLLCFILPNPMQVELSVDGDAPCFVLCAVIEGCFIAG